MKRIIILFFFIVSALPQVSFIIKLYNLDLIDEKNASQYTDLFLYYSLIKIININC